MTDLFLLRHGIAVPHGTPGVPEAERPLTSKGEAHVKDVAKGLKRMDIAPDRVVTSPLARARRTAEIVADVLGLEDELENAEVLSAGASPRAIRDWLATRPEQRLLIVGHNPDFTELAGLLIGVTISPLPFELKKGGVAALRSQTGGGYLLHWL